MSMKIGAGLGAIAMVVALSIVVPLSASEENSNNKNPFIGTWELKSDWGKGERHGTHIVSVNPDLTGTAKDLEEGWTSKLRNVELNGEDLSFAFFWGKSEEYEIEFEGTLANDEIKGEYSIFGATAVVVGAPMSAADVAAAAARKYVADYYEARTFTGSEGDTIPYRLFVPEDYDPKKKYPLILFTMVAAEPAMTTGKTSRAPWSKSGFCRKRRRRIRASSSSLRFRVRRPKRAKA